MIEVLFVDDEPRLLDGLRVALRGQRARWAMHFAPGGAEALELLASHHFDVVVSDLRMPRVDGAQVLREAQRQQPWAARIVLSGFAEMETTLRALPVAHQYLGKPCAVPTLVEVVERTARLQQLITTDAVRSVVGRVTSLPSLPRNYQAMQAAVADSHADAASLARVLERDVAMCAKILQLVNSAFFGLPRRVASIEEAVVFLGFDLVRNLALAGEVFRGGGRDLADLEQHSLEVAGLARQLVTDPQGAADACLAGMLHDLGKVVLATAWPELYAADAEAEGAVHELELSRLQTTHAEVGAYLLGLWGLPTTIVEAVANHHAPDRVALRAPGPLTAVAVADALVHEASGWPIPGALLAHLGALQLGPEVLEQWRARAAAMRRTAGARAPEPGTPQA
jgi:putative nucleotidyltransferase with HDIG domain